MTKFRLIATDVLLALIVALAWIASINTVEGENSLYIGLIYLALALINLVAIALWRTHLNLSILLIFTTVLTRYLFSPLTILPADFTVLLAIILAALRGTRNVRTATLLAGLLTGFLYCTPLLITDRSPNSWLVLMVLELIVAITFTTGTVLRMRNDERESRRRAEEREVANKLRDTELAVTEERTRIAREMHDIVAHTLSVVIAQADGGRYAAKANPQVAENALETIAEMSRAALADIRSIIGVLRDPNETYQALKPQPVDDDLDQLVAQVRDSGAKISFVRLGTAQPLPVGLGNALYRICQEAITNSLKHAGPQAQITVMLTWQQTRIVLEVTDDGRGMATHNDGHGHGLIGMEERAAVFGGTVEAQPRTEGGFRVRAVIPLAASTTSAWPTQPSDATKGAQTGSSCAGQVVADTKDARYDSQSTSNAVLAPGTTTALTKKENAQ